MTVYEKFVEMDNEANALMNAKHFDEAIKAGKQACDFRDKHFTKADWEKLITQSTGRAKYEYAKRMKELFPQISF